MWLVAPASALSLSGQDVDNPAAAQGGRKSGETRTVNCGDRIAQMVICQLPEVTLSAAVSLSETGRGTGGFGSSGKH